MFGLEHGPLGGGIARLTIFRKGDARATAKSRRTGRGVPPNPGPIGGLKNKLDADKAGWTRAGPSCLPLSADSSIVAGAGNPRTFSVHPRYFAFSLVYPADRSLTAQFGHDLDFAVTLVPVRGCLTGESREV